YILNGHPLQNTGDARPHASLTLGDLVFTYIRRSESASDTIQMVQYGNNLSDWTDLIIVPGTAGPVEIASDTPANGLETVTVTLPRPLEPGGRLFARLWASRP